MKKTHTILAVAAKARRLGIAVLSGKQLLYYRITSLGESQKNRLKVADEKLQNLINLYEPDILAFEELIYPGQQTKFFEQLVTGMTEIADKNRMKLKIHSPNTVRNYFCPKDNPSKEKVAQVLIQQYPELGKFIYRQSHWQKFYALQIFSAIALGLFCDDNLCQSKK